MIIVAKILVCLIEKLVTFEAIGIFFGDNIVNVVFHSISIPVVSGIMAV